MESDKTRFLAAGATTTVFSYALYLGLISFSINPMAAYVVSYVAGIGWSYMVNMLWVFRTKVRWRSFVRYPLVYALQAIASFLLFPLLLTLGIAAWAAPIVVTVIMLPCTYLLSRAIARN